MWKVAMVPVVDLAEGARLPTPISTYRLQITPTFDLDDAASIVDYVHALGADWLYLSPLLTAHPAPSTATT